MEVIVGAGERPGRSGWIQRLLAPGTKWWLCAQDMCSGDKRDSCLLPDAKPGEKEVGDSELKSWTDTPSGLSSEAS